MVQLADGLVAEMAEKTTNLSGLVVVINRKSALGVSDLFADSTDSALRFENAVVVFGRDAVLGAKHSSKG